MICNICGRYVEGKFYVHLNSNHRMKIGEYFSKFPNQKDEYESQKKIGWNKGLTKNDHPSIAKMAASIKEHTNTPSVRKERSERLKKRYSKGDILSPKQRAKVIRAGNKGWVQKVKLATVEERNRMLANFVKAGNKAQENNRNDLTPEDYERLYPWAKGKARFHHCDFCDRKMIVWFGGKPRPKLRFCNADCWRQYRELHPEYCFPYGEWFYSSKMEMEFYLHSNYEKWFALMLDGSASVVSWHTTPFVIWYEWLGKKRRYYPDFLVNGHYLVELKSGYVSNVQGESVRCKIGAAREFCEKENIVFTYIQIDGKNMTFEKFRQHFSVGKFFDVIINKE